MLFKYVKLYQGYKWNKRERVLFELLTFAIIDVDGKCQCSRDYYMYNIILRLYHVKNKHEC